MQRELFKVSPATLEYETSTNKRQIELHKKFFIENCPKGCDKCGRKSLLTLDHIVPFSVLTDMGFNPKLFYDEENLRILCRPCNVLKGNHLDFSTSKTKQLLIKYLRCL